MADVTLLCFEDCPNWREANANLQMLAEETSHLIICHQIVATDAAAEQRQFFGSPSIHTNGHDLLADPDTPVGLSCRLYQTPNGPAGSLTLEQLRHALITSTWHGPPFTTNTAQEPACLSTRWLLKRGWRRRVA